jgi:pyruvate dehydrogenase kinase 2/3/4
LLKRRRLAHRLRDIQTLPYVVVANPHLAHVYESYLRAFERFRRVGEIRSLDDNEKYCKVLEETLTEHATVIPRLATGVLEVRGLMKPEETDKFMTTMLRSVRPQLHQLAPFLTEAAHLTAGDCGAASCSDRDL